MTLLGLPGLAFAQEAAIRAVHVSGQGNRDLRLLAPVVQQQLIRQLGPRYEPGARGGATLTVDLTQVHFPVDTDAGFFSTSGDMDYLSGNVRVVAGRRAIAAFPLEAHSASVDASDEYQEPTPARLGSIGYAFAHAVVGRL